MYLGMQGLFSLGNETIIRLTLDPFVLFQKCLNDTIKHFWLLIITGVPCFFDRFKLRMRDKLSCNPDGFRVYQNIVLSSYKQSWDTQLIKFLMS